VGRYHIWHHSKRYNCLQDSDAVQNGTSYVVSWVLWEVRQVEPTSPSCGPLTRLLHKTVPECHSEKQWQSCEIQTGRLWQKSLINLNTIHHVNSSSSVSIVTKLRARRTGFDSRQGLGCFPRYRIQIGYGTTQLPIQWVPGDLSSAGGRAVKLITPLHLVQKLRMREARSPLPQYVFMTWYLSNLYVFMTRCLVKHIDNITFTLLFIVNIEQNKLC
jgi:hypothetical protein